MLTAAWQALKHAIGIGISVNLRTGIPPGVECEHVKWCDSGGICSRVCKRGSVQINPWLSASLQYQWRLARQQPLCEAQLLGTHNSAITLADGYGNRDEVLAALLRRFGMMGDADVLETYDHYLSLTDQLRLGVRMLELDTHYVEGNLRLAHCGGMHNPHINRLVDFANSLARLLRLKGDIKWDSETLGCFPSLSSIPAADQRTLEDALDEISDWMGDHPDEFLIISLDDQPNLAQWGLVQQLKQLILSRFPEPMLLTPRDVPVISTHLAAAAAAAAQQQQRTGRRLHQQHQEHLQQQQQQPSQQQQEHRPLKDQERQDQQGPHPRSKGAIPHEDASAAAGGTSGASPTAAAVAPGAGAPVIPPTIDQLVHDWGKRLLLISVTDLEGMEDLVFSWHAFPWCAYQELAVWEFKGVSHPAAAAPTGEPAAAGGNSGPSGGSSSAANEAGDPVAPAAVMAADSAAGASQAAAAGRRLLLRPSGGGSDSGGSSSSGSSVGQQQPPASSQPLVHDASGPRVLTSLAEAWATGKRQPGRMQQTSVGAAPAVGAAAAAAAVTAAAQQQRLGQCMVQVPAQLPPAVARAAGQAASADADATGGSSSNVDRSNVQPPSPDAINDATGATAAAVAAAAAAASGGWLPLQPGVLYRMPHCNIRYGSMDCGWVPAPQQEQEQEQQPQKRFDGAANDGDIQGQSAAGADDGGGGRTPADDGDRAAVPWVLGSTTTQAVDEDSALIEAAVRALASGRSAIDSVAVGAGDLSPAAAAAAALMAVAVDATPAGAAAAAAARTVAAAAAAADSADTAAGTAGDDDGDDAARVSSGHQADDSADDGDLMVAAAEALAAAEAAAAARMEPAPTFNDLNAGSLRQVVSCGVNIPAPDRLTPDLAEAYIWSWAKGHGPCVVSQSGNDLWSAVWPAIADPAARLRRWLAHAADSWQGLLQLLPGSNHTVAGSGPGGGSSPAAGTTSGSMLRSSASNDSVYTLPAPTPVLPQQQQSKQATGGWSLRKLLPFGQQPPEAQAQQQQQQQQPEETLCAYVSASDGRWRTAACDPAMLAALRGVLVQQHEEDVEQQRGQSRRQQEQIFGRQDQQQQQQQQEAPDVKLSRNHSGSTSAGSTAADPKSTSSSAAIAAATAAAAAAAKKRRASTSKTSQAADAAAAAAASTCAGGASAACPAAAARSCAPKTGGAKSRQPPPGVSAYACRLSAAGGQGSPPPSPRDHPTVVAELDEGAAAAQRQLPLWHLALAEAATGNSSSRNSSNSSSSSTVGKAGGRAHTAAAAGTAGPAARTADSQQRGLSSAAPRCPAGYGLSHPRSAYENLLLQQLMIQQGVRHAWLPLMSPWFEPLM